MEISSFLASQKNKLKFYEGFLQETPAEGMVTTLPRSMEWQGTLNRALIQAAGTRLDEFVLENVYRPHIGDVIVVPGFNLPTHHLFITITPEWDGRRLDLESDRALLNAYRKPMELAARLNLRTLAFAALGTGTRAFAPERAARLALCGIRDRWYSKLDHVAIVCPKSDVVAAFISTYHSMCQGKGPIQSEGPF